MHIVPWNTKAELLWVRSVFFPEKSSEDLRVAALGKVTAWSTRTRLPHYIDSTAALTSALLADVPGVPTLTIRLVYATALCRFVNGLLDPLQTERFAKSMHKLARELGLPASFVEIRHAATHEELPSVSVLREASQRGLQWLWANYWERLEDNSETPEITVRKARGSLRTWRKIRASNPTGKVSLATSELSEAVNDCILLAREDPDVLIEALLEEKALIPKGDDKVQKMKGAFMLWGPFLELLDSSVDNFVELLVYAMLDVLKSTSMEPVNEDDRVTADYNKVLVSWIAELGSTTNRRFSTNFPAGQAEVENLAKECLMSPNEWTVTLLQKLAKGNKSLAKYAKLGSSISKGISASKTDDISLESAKESLDNLLTKFSTIQRRIGKGSAGTTANTSTAIAPERKTHKWRKWEGDWDPKPLGVV